MVKTLRKIKVEGFKSIESAELESGDLPDGHPKLLQAGLFAVRWRLALYLPCTALASVFARLPGGPSALTPRRLAA
ncbi:hypothetical protein PY257_11040 [Ramlibacter sp. H39-3-26]|uniref:hypothetical protein n=1 Tax=Curvibacter soli TaxID=3031331 RepID=UPI0023DB62D3|nr:hypothetical protein [Ramlibacter sp. H39-3-26]MDF1485707.1 hypothetical protein [Ramlibacter sp. H39-3-26]